MMNPIDMYLNMVFTAEAHPKLKELLSIEKKSELVKYAKTIEINQRELVDLIHGCPKIGYGHFINQVEIIPEHLKLTDEDKSVRWENGPSGKLEGKALKAFNKICETFNQRKYRVAHLFVGMEKWHLIYFDLRDMKEGGNHWVEGSHIHFVNHLFSNANIDEVIRDFRSMNINLGKRIHIKYAQPEHGAYAENAG